MDHAIVLFMPNLIVQIDISMIDSLITVSVFQTKDLWIKKISNMSANNLCYLLLLRHVYLVSIRRTLHHYAFYIYHRRCICGYRFNLYPTLQ